MASTMDPRYPVSSPRLVSRTCSSVGVPLKEILLEGAGRAFSQNTTPAASEPPPASTVPSHQTPGGGGSLNTRGSRQRPISETSQWLFLCPGTCWRAAKVPPPQNGHHHHPHHSQLQALALGVFSTAMSDACSEPRASAPAAPTARSPQAGSSQPLYPTYGPWHCPRWS